MDGSLEFNLTNKQKKLLKHNIKDIFREALVFNPFIPQIYIKKLSRKSAICISDDSALHKNNLFSYEWSFLFFNWDFLRSHCLWRLLGFPDFPSSFFFAPLHHPGPVHFFVSCTQNSSKFSVLQVFHLLPEGLRKVI